MKRLLHKIKSKLLTMFGDIKIFRFPFFLVYDPDDYAISGEETQKIQEILEPGDIILRGYRHYADGYAIKLFSLSTADSAIGGDWSHGAIYVGNGKIIHAVAEGVSETTVVDFTRCDRIAVFRPKKGKTKAIKIAKKYLKENVPYDVNFQYGSSALYCFELAALSYPKLDIPTYNIRKLFGLLRRDDVYLAKSFVDSPDLKLVYCCNPKFGIEL